MACAIERLPDVIDGGGSFRLRRWHVEDVETLGRSVVESIAHLRPWMEWAAHEPLSFGRRRELLIEWQREWLAGGDVVYGTLIGDVVVGGCGLHHRVRQDGLEIGYWTHPQHVRQGFATKAARLLTEAAFTMREITRVEIHHDKANLASAAIPAKLRFCLIAELLDEPKAPNEIGVECQWRMDRDRWMTLRDRKPPPGSADDVGEAARVTAT